MPVQVPCPFKPTIKSNESIENFDKIWTDLPPTVGWAGECCAGLAGWPTRLCAGANNWGHHTVCVHLRTHTICVHLCACRTRPA